MFPAMVAPLTKQDVLGAAASHPLVLGPDTSLLAFGAEVRHAADEQSRDVVISALFLEGKSWHIAHLQLTLAAGAV